MQCNNGRKVSLDPQKWLPDFRMAFIWLPFGIQIYDCVLTSIWNHMQLTSVHSWPRVQCIHHICCPHHNCHCLYICLCICDLHICHKYAIDKCPQPVQCIHRASPASLIRLLCRPQYLSKWHISPQTMIHTQIDAHSSLLGGLVIFLMLQGIHFSSLLHAFL